MPGPEHRLALPIGFRFAEYSIVKVLGQGGFGITYLARDTNLNIEVAIKEMLPRDFVTRVEGVTVMPKSAGDANSFAWAKERFIEEARILASVRHENIVHVFRFLQLHGTAYLVMEFVQGDNFMEWIKVHKKPSEAELKAILFPLLEGLERVHKMNVLHRDISPENILITTDGRPMLLDFGAARTTIDRKTAMTGVIRPGYSPVEQYQTDEPQGPYTDLYALGGVMIHAITGRQPPLSMDRFADVDPYEPLAERYKGKYSDSFLRSLDCAFAIEPENRPQNIPEWKRMLAGEFPKQRSGVKQAPQPKKERRAAPKPKPKLVPSGPIPPKKSPLLWVLLTVALLAMVGGAGYFVFLDKPDGGGDPGNGTPKPEPTPIRTPSPATPPPATPTPAPAAAPTFADAIKSGRYTNSLGMEFVRVPGTNAMFCTIQTRRKDYEAFAQAESGVSPDWRNVLAWNKVPVGQDPEHPVVMVSAEDAKNFCRWLSEKDSRERGFAVTYRLPTWAEWRKARGNAKYPWGDQDMPAPGAGNYADESARKAFGKNFTAIAGYDDGFPTTSPVKNFHANSLGLYDFGGNVQEWSADLDMATSETLVLGASWKDAATESLIQKDRPEYHENADKRRPFIGFRCVLALPED